MKQNKFIEELISITKENLNNVQQLQDTSVEALNSRKSETSWSALECIQHLNLYSDFYHPEITKRLDNISPFEGRESERNANVETFKSSWLGKKFIDSVTLKDTIKPMNSPKNMNPSLKSSELNEDVLSKFINDQKELLDLLNKSREVSLMKVKTSISLSKLIKLRLGDTFGVIIHHNERHVAQALKAVELTRH
jgi:hypothetical protein